MNIYLPKEYVEFLKKEKTRTGESMSNLVQRGLDMYSERPLPAATTGLRSVGKMVRPPAFTMPPIPTPTINPKLTALYTPAPPVPQPAFTMPPITPAALASLSVDITARDEARDRYDDTGPYDQPFEEWYATQRSLGVLP